MRQSDLALCKFKSWTQNGDAGTTPNCVGDLDAIRVAQWMRPPISSPNDTTSCKNDSETRKLRVHPANLLPRRNLNAPLVKIRSSHGWCYEP